MTETVVINGVRNFYVENTWHACSIDVTAQRLETDTRLGLTQEEAERRLVELGANELPEKKIDSIWIRIWRQINNVLVLILVVVAVVSLVKAITSSGEKAMTNWIELGLITGVVVLNTWIGIKQEGNAEKSASALKAMLSTDALVIRDGKKVTVAARELVVGDLIVLETGDKIPADCRLIKVSNFSCQEAALTGEAVPVNKVSVEIVTPEPSSVPLGDRKNMAFSATLVTQGEAHAIVVSAGEHTEIGQINALVNNAKRKKTNVEIQIDLVSKVLAGFVFVVALIALFVAKYGKPQMEWIDAVSTALIICVAMIPEGLFAIVTLTYAYAVNQMAKSNAIVRVLPAVETLGSVTVICSDKTGTLTKNEMTMVAFVTSNARYRLDVDRANVEDPFCTRDDHFMRNSSRDSTVEPATETEPLVVKDGESPSLPFIRQLLEGGVLCSHAIAGATRQDDIGNPTELAIVRAMHHFGIDYMQMRLDQPIVSQIPFSSEDKFMATCHELPGGDKFVVHVKGATDKLIARCDYQCKDGIVSASATEPINRDYWLRQAASLSSQGLRVLALCRSEIPTKQNGELTKGDLQGLTLCCLCAILDPPRPECIDAIKEAHNAGVRVAMITGDHRETALAIGKMLGIVDKNHSHAVTGPELDAMTDDELRVAVMENNIFARASPANKIDIVKALQSQGQVASMTGDGVNDAPALKAADVGVAMGKEGTDVAREASEIILVDDNFSTIVTAIRFGRSVWNNLRKILLINTPINNSQGLVVLCGIIGGLENSALTPIQVLYCNLITAITLGMVLAIEPAEKGIMDEPPRKTGKRLMGRFLILRIMLGTIALTGVSIGTLFWCKSWNTELTNESLWDICDSCSCTAGLCATCDLSIPGLCVGSFKPGQLDEIKTSCDAVVNTSCDYTKVDYAPYNWNKLRAQASNSLTFGAIAVMMSARFAYQNSFHPRLLHGNIWVWYSAGVTAALQIVITYVPGLNDVVFQMEGMDGAQWALVAFAFCVVFFSMELEKLVRRMLKSRGFQADDTEEFEEHEMESSFHSKASIASGTETEPQDLLRTSSISSSNALSHTLLPR